MRRLWARGRRYLPWAGLLVLLGLFWSVTHDFMLYGYTGLFNDDGFYFTSGRALVEGKGYIVPWLKQPIPADRFPIGYPAWLALFWTFPTAFLETRVVYAQEANVVLALGFLAVSFGYCYHKLGLPAWACLAGLGLAAFSPFCLYYTPTLMSDLPAAFLLATALWLTHSFIERAGPGRLAAAAVAAAVAILFRYAAAVLPLAGVGYLLLRRRFGAAVAYGAAVAALLAPWVFWVMSHRAFGYAEQIAHQTHGEGRMRLLSLAFSAGYLFLQGLPSLLWPGLFLPGFPMRSQIDLFGPLLITVGLTLSGTVLAGLGLAALRRKEWRLPAAFAAATLLLELFWQTGFLNLGEHLTVRLLLPIAPLLLSLALAGWALGLNEARRGAKIAAAAALALVLLLDAGAVYSLRMRMVHQIVPKMLGERRYLQGLLREFARQVPPEMEVQTNFEPLFHLVTGRRCGSAAPNPKVLAAQILTNPKAQYLLMMPSPAGTKDLTVEAIRAVNHRFPGLINTIYNPNGSVSGVFRLDRKAIDRAPVLEDDDAAPKG